MMRFFERSRTRKLLRFMNTFESRNLKVEKVYSFFYNSALLIAIFQNNFFRIFYSSNKYTF